MTARQLCRSRAPRHLLVAVTAGFLLLCSSAALLAAAPDQPFPTFHGIDYRHIGPPGNRVTAVTGVPGSAGLYYVGAASGGIFKTTDGGISWSPIFDHQPASSIGALAIAPADHNVVWVGTGESFLRANVSIGNGVYRSTDGGDSWQHLGLESSGRIPRILVDPQDSDTALVAALGHCYGPQSERGVYRTTDGGKTWQQTLFVDQLTGAVDLAFDPNNSRIVFAAMWQMHMDTWSRTSGGPGSGLYRSTDGGSTWHQLDPSSGLPNPPYGRIGLATTPADSQRIYALIETSSNSEFAPVDQFAGVLWRSTDGGNSWSLTSRDNNLVQRPLYYSRAVVSPVDADDLHFLSVRHSRSLDGGFHATTSDPQPGWDHHDMWIDPSNVERMIVGHDGGVSISTTGGSSWLRPQLPIAQMYHVAVDRQVPYFVYGNRQDGRSARGPSYSLGNDHIPIGTWQSVGGCEVGFTIPDLQQPNTIWSGCYDGILEVHDLESGISRDVSVWPEAAESWPAEDLRYRFHWTYPILISPHDHSRVFVASQFVHQTTNGGQSWSIVSPDLTSNDPKLQQRTGGLTLDDAGPTLGPSIFALDESPLEPGVIWAGTNDGKLHITRDGGQHWQDLTEHLPVPPRGTISNIEASSHDAATCYVTVDRHQLADFSPYVLRTDDYGRSWTSLSSSLPDDELSFAHCVREDPVRREVLYLGTESGVWVSANRGDQWQSLQLNLPHAPIHWIEVQDHFHDLVIASYGRGFWILDDITPLRVPDPSAFFRPEGGAKLLAPRAAYRFQAREPVTNQPNDPAAGTNPPYGALLHYQGSPSKAPVEIEVRDDSGKLVRTLSGLSEEPGLHRLVWDLRSEASAEVRLRTPPSERASDPLPDSGWRPLSDGSRIAPLVPPGNYHLRFAGSMADAVVLEVKIDPWSTPFAGELAQQSRVLEELRDLQDRVATMINEIEWIRKRLLDLIAELEHRQDVKPVSAILLGELERVEQEFRDLEARFFDLRLSGARQDTLRWKRLLYAKLSHLANSLGRNDRRPTDQQLEVLDVLRSAVEQSWRDYLELRDSQLPKIDRRLSDAGIGPVVIPLAEDASTEY